MEILKPKYDNGNGKTGVYAVAEPVTRKNWRAAKRAGRELLAFLDEKQDHFEGDYKRAWALSHGQCIEQPFSMFVVSDEFAGRDEGRVNHVNYYWRSRLIFNPVVLETPESFEVEVPKRDVKRVAKDKAEVEMKIEKVKRRNLYYPEIKEACMSFPGRTGKHMERFFRIKVSYDVIGMFGQRKHVEEWIEGIKAHIFQHEAEHQQGIIMYYRK